MSEFFNSLFFAFFERFLWCNFASYFIGKKKIEILKYAENFPQKSKLHFSAVEKNRVDECLKKRNLWMSNNKNVEKKKKQKYNIPLYDIIHCIKIYTNTLK